MFALTYDDSLRFSACFVQQGAVLSYNFPTLRDTAMSTVVFAAMPLILILQYPFSVWGSLSRPFPCIMSMYMKHTKCYRRRAICSREERWWGSSMPPQNSKDNSVTKPKPGPGPHSLTWVSPPPLLAWSLSLYVPLLWSLTCQDAVL